MSSAGDQDFVVISDHSPKGTEEYQEKMNRLADAIDLFDQTNDSINQYHVLLKDKLRLALEVVMQNIEPVYEPDNLKRFIDGVQNSVGTATDETRHLYVKNLCSRLLASDNEKQKLYDALTESTAALNKERMANQVLTAEIQRLKKKLPCSDMQSQMFSSATDVGMVESYYSSQPMGVPVQQHLSVDPQIPQPQPSDRPNFNLLGDTKMAKTNDGSREDRATPHHVNTTEGNNASGNVTKRSCGVSKVETTVGNDQSGNLNEFVYGCLKDIVSDEVSKTFYSQTESLQTMIKDQIASVINKTIGEQGAQIGNNTSAPVVNSTHDADNASVVPNQEIQPASFNTDEPQACASVSSITHTNHQMINTTNGNKNLSANNSDDPPSYEMHMVKDSTVPLTDKFSNVQLDNIFLHSMGSNRKGTAQESPFSARMSEPTNNLAGKFPSYNADQEEPKCPICNATFPSRSLLETHLENCGR